MDSKFDKLFGRLPPTLTRYEDGTLRIDKTHPDVQPLLKAIQACRDAGDPEWLILKHVEEAMRDALRVIGGNRGR